MTTINQLLKEKGPAYFSVHPDETVYSAIKKMGEKGIGALLVMDRATLVGETTYGKRTVQQWIELQDSGALKLTIAKWLTPDKRWIHRVGIVPEVTVTTPEQPNQDEDPALDKAVETLATVGAVGRFARYNLQSLHLRAHLWPKRSTAYPTPTRLCSGATD